MGTAKYSTKRAESTKLHLTEKMVNKLPLPPKLGRATVMDDGGARGLGVLLRNNGRHGGSRSYFWYRKVNGRGRWKALGDTSNLRLDGPDGARDLAGLWNTKADRWRADGYPADANPFADQQVYTLAEVLERFVVKRIPKCKRPVIAEEKLRQRANKHLRGLLSMRLSEITDTMVADLHTGMVKTPRMANMVLQIVGALYRFALEEHMYRGLNPAQGLDRHKAGEIKRERFILPEEMAAVRRSLDRSPCLSLRHFVELSLLTGARSGDVMAMRWEDLILDGDEHRAPTWKLPDSKSGPYDAVLPPQAVTILRARQVMRLGDDPWVFPSEKNGSGHLVNLRMAWDDMIKDAKLWSTDPNRRLRIHDLRRTFASWQAMRGMSLPHIATALGHRGMRAVEVYARLQPSAVRAGVEDSSTATWSAMNAKEVAQPPARPAKRKALPAKIAETR